MAYTYIDTATYDCENSPTVHTEPQKQWFLNTMFCFSFVFLCLFLVVIIQFNCFSYNS